ncbi:MAG: LysE family translocator, partial [Waterburya sp.]
MEFVFLFQGMLIGFLVAAPIGVVGLLCINRTLLQGRINGFVSGLGAATAHGIYGSIAGFGLTFITNFLIEEQFYIRLIGGTFLYYLGVKTFVRRSNTKKLEVNSRNLITSYLS